MGCSVSSARRTGMRRRCGTTEYPTSWSIHLTDPQAVLVVDEIRIACLVGRPQVRFD